MGIIGCLAGKTTSNAVVTGGAINDGHSGRTAPYTPTAVEVGPIDAGETGECIGAISAGGGTLRANGEIGEVVSRTVEVADVAE
jgi:hypothetical protein